MFGPELLLTHGDIAEGDVFNVTWTGSSILSRGCSTVSLLSLKRIEQYWSKAFRWVTIETYCFQITPNLSPGPSRIRLQWSPPSACSNSGQACADPPSESFACRRSRVAQPAFKLFSHTSGVAGFCRPRPIPGSARLPVQRSGGAVAVVGPACIAA